ncbi:putative glyoxalase superfamily protein PhnB [Crossiella equi]|uniref:Glyoxalase superfamily protein PhnB n=1 Tax=Crossiella equi TaxID=130796 RepID=A0ABS5A554_9PSEU|nr:VOC family protein [Crossiella equi]MBP2471377.1 putative glyoxalase superfamily protein PhnB [Crossiella equi]
MTNAHLPSIYPTLRYTDADAAIDFLTSVFGLRAKSVSRHEDGTVGHAELSWGNGLVMLGQRGPEPGPFDTGRAVLYLVAPDVDAHHDRTVAGGATVVMGLVDQPYGSREYAATDPEGNVWCFGTYQPAP